MSTWNANADHMTVVCPKPSRNAEPLAAIAWRGSDLIAVEFHAILETEVGNFPFAREVRFFEVVDGYPDRMPVDDLLRLLEVWRKHEMPLLPLYKVAELTGDSGGFYSRQYSAAELRQAPFSEMRKRLLLEYSAQDAEDRFNAPEAKDLELVAGHPDWFAATGWTARTSTAHLAQLAAIAPYMASLESNQPPIQCVAKTLGVSANRARNLIQFARENGYLGGGSQGASRGKPTRKAADLADTVREVAAAIRAKQGTK